MQENVSNADNAPIRNQDVNFSAIQTIPSVADDGAIAEGSASSDARGGWSCRHCTYSNPHIRIHVL
ncbi:6004_t:CDS:2 [Ambispora gerdemannii]|uniref:6004_t:CDS:1 n=1 Tax=Ambispora gerdemannii TaxID=144530 RepID=A0A9N9DG24_9GLOM|nr:6004_t:CDS:2 [Ambispora gerdemannii]